MQSKIPSNVKSPCFPRFASFWHTNPHLKTPHISSHKHTHAHTHSTPCIKKEKNTERNLKISKSWGFCWVDDPNGFRARKGYLLLLMLYAIDGEILEVLFLFIFSAHLLAYTALQRVMATLFNMEIFTFWRCYSLFIYISIFFLYHIRCLHHLRFIWF